MPQKIQWIVDGYGVDSLHRNEPGLSFKESYLGCIVRRTGAAGEYQWYFSLKGRDELDGPHKNISEAKSAAIRLVGGEYT